MIKTKENSFVSAVIYCHNCEKTVEPFFNLVHTYLEENFKSFEMIFVNDYSTDKTVDIIKNMSKQHSGNVISVISMSYFQGKEKSLNAGVDISIGDFVFEFENTFIDYNQETLQLVYKKMQEGYDIVGATRKNKKFAFADSVFYKIYNTYSYNSQKIEAESFRIVSRRAINRVSSVCANVPFRKAAYSQCGLSYQHIKYSPIIEKGYKKNRFQKHNQIDSAYQSLLLFTDATSKFAISMTVLMLLTGLGTGITLIVQAINGISLSLFLSLICFISFALSFIFIVLDLIIKYLIMNVNLIFFKQNYIVESISKINTNTSEKE